MVQPADFGFSEQHALLRESAKRYFAEHLPADRLHALVAADPNPHKSREARWKPELWRQMADLGWTMLAVPESAGGIGLAAVAVAALCEEAGKAAFPSPLLATVNTTYVLAACESSSATSALAAIAEGAAASLVLYNERGRECSTSRVERGRLTGVGYFVQDAQKVAYFLVRAGSCLYWVASEADGVTVHPDAIIDLTRDQATVSFEGVEATLVSDDANAVLRQAMPAILTMLAADMVGAGEWQLQTTVEYAKTRQQFDRPLGFFQALKHPLVNVMIEVDKSKSLVYNAACAIDTEPERAEAFAHMAKACASEMARFASSRSIQFHGGIGFTWECFLHLYFKRQMHSQALWGDGAWHRSQLASILMGAPH
ncbi:acyl-CoA dehydrogenase family protein [Haliea sp. E1-2-M8]|uniref:acyl-CoA dehydrogenase family protein n=1 Tax=Haliea sp. E1-2-M8 TaxID=3064706 RepID=UPI002720F412|nr:acyl-CoA dehydrogenase family protein [Haliea sp. E1-2-M8]MDO8864061.1 acyl-CoA dehydrogenase family protein [Haliea sp. E1-2-M8]